MSSREKACEPCKRQKKKCYEDGPTCQRCARLQIECIRSTKNSYKFVVQTGVTGLKISQTRKRKLGNSKTSPGVQGDSISANLDQQTLARRKERDCLEPVILIQPRHIKLLPREVVYFDRFRNDVVYQLGSQSFDEFWRRTILRESSSDDCVLEVILALGALSYSLDANSKSVPLWKIPLLESRNKEYADAMRYYTKSLSKFRSRMSSGSVASAQRSVLISSILFSAFEFLQGNTTSAERLMDHGATVLKGAILNSSWPERQSTIAAACDDDGMEDAEHILMRRLTIRGLLAPLKTQTEVARIIQVCAFPYMNGPDPPSQKEGFDVFWKGFMRLFTLIIMWHIQNEHYASVYSSDLNIFPDLGEQQQRQLLSKIKLWRKATQKKFDSEQDFHGHQILRKLLTGMTALQFLVQTTFEDKDMLHPTSLKLALEAISMGELVLKESLLFQSGQGEIYDGIQCMSFVLVRIYRNQELRSRAMSLGGRTINAQSRWDAKEIYMACSALVALEESGRDESGGISLENRYDWFSSHWNEDYTEFEVTFTAKIQADGYRDVKMMKLRPEDFGLV